VNAKRFTRFAVPLFTVQVTSMMLSLLREANEETKRQMIVYDTHRTDLLAVMTAALTCDSVALYGIVPSSHRLTDYYLVTHRAPPAIPANDRQESTHSHAPVVALVHGPRWLLTQWLADARRAWCTEL